MKHPQSELQYIFLLKTHCMMKHDLKRERNG